MKKQHVKENEKRDSKKPIFIKKPVPSNNKVINPQPIIRYHDIDDEEPIKLLPPKPSISPNFKKQEISLKLIIPKEHSESIENLTKQFKKLGNFPTKQNKEPQGEPKIQPSAVKQQIVKQQQPITQKPQVQQPQNVFSLEWVKKKQAALERRKSRLKQEDLARKVIDKWKLFAKDGLDKIKAKNYRNKILITKCFNYWKKKKEDRDSMWKREFILQTRHKFVTYQIFFHKWREMYERSILQEREAINHGFMFLSWKLQVKSIQALKNYVEYRKKKNQNMLIANQYSNHRITRKVFNVYKKIMEMEKKFATAEDFHLFMLKNKTLFSLKKFVKISEDERVTKADEFRNENLMRKVLISLNNYKVYKHKKKEDIETYNQRADDFFKSKRLKIYFEIIVNYCKTRKEKALRNEIGMNFRNKHTKKKYFYFWNNLLSRKLNLNEIDNYSIAFRRRSILKTFFNKWKEKYFEKLDYTKKLKTALVYDNLRMMYNCFSPLKQYWLYRKEKKEKLNNALRFNRFCTAFRYFQLWKNKYSINEEKHIRDITLVHQFHERMNVKLILKVFEGFRRNVGNMRLKEKEEDNIVSKYRAILKQKKLNRIFKAWYKHHELKALSKINNARALIFYNKSLKLLALKGLYNFTQHKGNKKELEHRAKNFLLKKLGKRFLTTWRHKTDKSLEMKCKLKKADYANNKTILKRSFFALRHFSVYSKNKTKLKVEALQRRNTLLMRRGLLQWMESAYEKQQLRKRQLRMNYNKYDFDKMSVVEKFARYWLYITVRNSQKRRPDLFQKFKQIPIPKQKPIIPENLPLPENNHSHIKGNTNAVQVRHFSPKRPAPRRPVELILEEEIGKQQPMGDISRVQKQNPKPIENNNSEKIGVLYEEIERITKVLNEYDELWTPTYLAERTERKNLKTIIESNSLTDEELIISTRKGRDTGSSSRGRLSSNTTTPKSGSNSNSTNLIALIDNAAREVGFACFNLRTNTVYLTQYNESSSYSNTCNMLKIYEPVEVVFPKSLYDSKLPNVVKQELETKVSFISRKFFNENKGFEFIEQLIIDEHRSVVADTSTKYLCVSCLCAIIQYIEYIQEISIAPHSLKINYIACNGFLLIDSVSITNLELVRSLKYGNTNGTLLSLLDYSKTPMGKRMIRSNILQPLTDNSTLNARLDCVDELLARETSFFDLGTCLTEFGSVDFSHLLTQFTHTRKASTSRFALNLVLNIIYLRHLLTKLPDLQKVLSAFSNALLVTISVTLESNNLTQLKEEIDSILDEASITKCKNKQQQACFAVKPAIDGLLDVARKQYIETIEEIHELHKKYQNDTGLSTLKVRYNVRRGYHLCIDDKNKLSPETQKLFIQRSKKGRQIHCSTSELNSLNVRLRDIMEEIYLLTENVINKLTEKIRQNLGQLFKISESIGLLDMLFSFATLVTLSNNYIRPEFTDEGPIAIKSGRHPVLEKTISGGSYVSNDTYLSESGNLHIITGANMSGKSTYLRQVASIQILSQIGSYVPASFCSIRIADRIFTRIGTNDDLENNNSTFMVEMKEVANIIQNASNKSLIIIDELGRSSSNIEGSSIAWSVTEYLASLRAYTLFATHYTELSELDTIYPNIRNMHLKVSTTQDGELNYLYHIETGSCNQDRYGIKLAKMLGISNDIIIESEKLLQQLLEKKQRVRSNEEELNQKKLAFGYTSY
ncbi:hypothetical protein ABK040_014433 [Willaertia magna]